MRVLFRTTLVDEARRSRAAPVRAAESNHQRPSKGAREISARIVVPRAERGGADGARPGDWACPKCNANVFASKTACYKCGEPKPSGGGGGGYDRGGDRYGGRDDYSGGYSGRGDDYRRRSPERDRDRDR